MDLSCGSGHSIEESSLAGLLDGDRDGQEAVNDERDQQEQAQDEKVSCRHTDGGRRVGGTFWIPRDALACCGKMEVTTPLSATLTKSRPTSWGASTDTQARRQLEAGQAGSH